MFWRWLPLILLHVQAVTRAMTTRLITCMALDAAMKRSHMEITSITSWMATYITTTMAIATTMAPSSSDNSSVRFVVKRKASSMKSINPRAVLYRMPPPGTYIVEYDKNNEYIPTESIIRYNFYAIKLLVCDNRRAWSL